MIIALFAVTLSFAIAANSEDKNVSEKIEKSSNETEKNMTYGQCVSAAAEVKNNCYAEIKNLSNSCNLAAENVKSSAKECQNSYKQGKTQCKADFKAVKNECKKIKHNFFETARYAFY